MIDETNAGQLPADDEDMTWDADEPNTPADEWLIAALSAVQDAEGAAMLPYSQQSFQVAQVRTLLALTFQMKRLADALERRS